MPLVSYEYSVSDDFPYHKVDLGRLTYEIQSSSIIVALDHIDVSDDVCSIWFKTTLSGEDVSVLGTIVDNHSGEPLPSDTVVGVSIKETDINVPMSVKGFRDLTGHNVYIKGYLVEIPGGHTREHEVAYTSDMYLFGIGLRTNDAATFYDYIEVEMVDVDNIFGYGPDFVLAQFASTLYVHANLRYERVCEDAKLLPAGIYIRTRYVSSGQENLAVQIDHYLRT